VLYIWYVVLFQDSINSFLENIFTSKKITLLNLVIYFLSHTFTRIIYDIVPKICTFFQH